MVKNPPVNAGDTRHEGLITELGRFPGAGHGNPIQYSCLENSIDRESWQHAVHEIADSDTTERLTHSFTLCCYAHSAVISVLQTI